MTMVSVDKEVIVDLINSKLRLILEDMDSILHKWNYQTAEKFLEDARTGVIKNAEDDAVVFRNLLDEHDKLVKLKKSWD